MSSGFSPWGGGGVVVMSVPRSMSCATPSPEGWSVVGVASYAGGGGSSKLG